MIFYSYLKFTYFTLAKKWSVYICNGLYLLVLALFMYLFPVLLKYDLFNAYRYKITITMIIVFAVIAASNLSVNLFRATIDDGTDLLISSKPISRSQMIGGKFIVLIINIFCVSAFATIIASFTTISPYNDYDMNIAIIIGSGIGTFIVYLVWSAIAILFCLLFKKSTVVLATLGIQVCLLVISAVCSLVVVPPNKYIQQQHKNLRMNNVCLVQDPNESSDQIHPEYQWATFLYQKNNLPITNQTKYNGISLEKQGISTADLLANLWAYGEQHSNRQAIVSLDLDYQLASLYAIYTPQTTNDLGNGPAINRILNSDQHSEFWNLDFSRSGYAEIAKQINAMQLTSPNNFNYTLIANPYVSFKVSHNNNFHTVHTDTYFPKAHGKSLYAFNEQTLSYPKIQKRRLVLGEFHNLQEFGKYYYSTLVPMSQRFIQGMKKKNSEFTYANTSSFYSSLLTIYLSNNQEIHPEQWQTKNEIKPYFQKFNDQYNLFQYWSYRLLQDYLTQPNQYSWLKPEGILNILHVLNCFPENTHPSQQIQIWNTSCAFVGNSRQLWQYLNRGHNTNNWLYFVPQFALMPEEQLATLSIATVEPALNLTALAICWSLLAFILMAVAIKTYSNKEFI